MNNYYDELILSSGSIKASIFVGGLIELEKYFPLHNFKYLTGCSAGGIIITMINIGYTLIIFCVYFWFLCFYPYIYVLLYMCIKTMFEYIYVINLDIVKMYECIHF